MNKKNLKNNHFKNKLSLKEEKIIERLIKYSAEDALMHIKQGALKADEVLITELGARYIRNKKNLDAIKIYKFLLDKTKPNISLYNNLTYLICEYGDYAEALIYAKKAYEIMPSNKVVIKNYFLCLLAVGDAETIKTTCESVSKDNLEDNDIKFTLASAKRILGDSNGAIKLLNELELKTNEDKYKYALLEIIGDRDSAFAVKEFESYQFIGKDIPVVHKFNLSLHYLRLRKFSIGWKFFEYGLDKNIGPKGRKLPYNLVNTFRADKMPIEKSVDVLICSEQGIGDQLIFLSAMNNAIDDFLNIFMICESRMLPIIKRSFPSIKTSSNGQFDSNNLVDPNYNKRLGYIPLGSLFAFYRKDMNGFLDTKKAYISPDPNLHQSYQNLLRNIGGARRIIGISWKSNVDNHTKNFKNIDFIDWITIFDTDTLIINLQYGDSSEEQSYIASLGLEMLSFNNLDFTKDLESWLAIIASCDGILSISTSLIHFAGSIGQKVSVLMPEPQGHWSLGVNEVESILYPKVKILRKIDQYESNCSLILRGLNLLQ